ncbi:MULTISPECIES: flagellar protein FliT [Paenibacillus]|uniref:flagellar protein FliT n=1 Tax=Paenibacillus TaxID=44249 RepID=UPI000B89C216|nr:flagellar protein FliT [Paenibacillus amylolyticus]
MNNNHAAIDMVLSELSVLTHSFMLQLETRSSDETENFVNERQVLVGQLREALDVQEMDNEQQDELKRILGYDQRIQGHMLSLKNEAQQWLTQRSAARSQRSVYENNYTVGSYLMDKRK